MTGPLPLFLAIVYYYRYSFEYRFFFGGYIDMSGSFRGRSLSVIKDLSKKERLFLFEKTQELKRLLEKDDRKGLEAFRINDADFGIYEVFLEDSTRTRESFSNAAQFHGAKLSMLNAGSSSFNKGESYADTFFNLAGYNNQVFIIRSKHEGVCTWLTQIMEEYAKRNNLPYPPSFINAGDGKHEHPTQELLDEFTFLEDNDWSTEHLHVALVGDLFHGRTVHSKVQGLTLFNKVKVDLVAPKELEMPIHYVEEMKNLGYEVRIFTSIEEYLAAGNCAKKWYFTRPQLERMGERILEKQHILRESITFREEFLSQISDDTIFYHPLPRRKDTPVIPTFLDNTPHNGWERQSANGMLVRIMLLLLFSGKLDSQFDFPPAKKEDESTPYINSVPVAPKKEIKKHSEGVHPISKGLVIDHLYKGETPEEIRKGLSLIVKVLNLHGKGGEWISTSSDGNYKGLIFRPGHQGLSKKELKRLAAVAPSCTINTIDGGQVTDKYTLSLPPEIYNFEYLSCKNQDCISHKSLEEGVPAHFYRVGENSCVCRYCGKHYTMKEVWK